MKRDKEPRAKQRKSIDLRTVDDTSQEYWEEILARENLRMTRGDDARLVFYDPPALERIEGEIETYAGRVEPHPTHD